MLGARQLTTVLLVFGVAALAVPAVTLAAGGGSAGDQQYTDPFGSSQPKTATTHSEPAPTTTPSAPAPTPSSSSPASDPSTTSASTPTATTADSTTSSGSATTLPYTGYDSWAAGALGLVLIGGGLSLRRRTSRG